MRHFRGQTHRVYPMDKTILSIPANGQYVIQKDVNTLKLPACSECLFSLDSLCVEAVFNK